MSVATMETNTPYTQLRVAAGIIWQGTTFLAAKRQKSKPLADFWEFPGGKCEEGEDPAQALMRELKEELNIDVLSAVFWDEFTHTYSEEHLIVRLFFYHVQSFRGEPKSNEGQVIRWVTPVEALQLNFLPADQIILTKLNTLRLLTDLESK